jgi:hypothetical protein
MTTLEHMRELQERERRLLYVAETQLARLAADGDEASAKALWPYVKRGMGR